MIQAQTRTVVERMVQAAICASRCRQAIAEDVDTETCASLARAADRYSQRVADLAILLIEDAQ